MDLTKQLKTKTMKTIIMNNGRIENNVELHAQHQGFLKTILILKNMKKGLKLIALVVLVSIVSQSIAQTKFGIKGGVNLANMAFKDMGDMTKKMAPSFHLGGIVQIGVTESFCIEPGLFLSGKGCKMETSATNSGVTITGKSSILPMYLEIPLNAMYKMDLGSAKLEVFAGPYFGFGVAGKTKVEYTASGLPSGVTLASLGLNDESNSIKYGTKDDSDLKKTDFGLNMGVGFESKSLFFRLQYGMGLSDLSPVSSSDNYIKNRVIGLSVGFLFSK